MLEDRTSRPLEHMLDDDKHNKEYVHFENRREMEASAGGV
jgi:hypothetical protein